MPGRFFSTVFCGIARLRGRSAKVPLGRLYGAELQDWLKHHGVDFADAARSQGRSQALEISADRVAGLVLRDETTIKADWTYRGRRSIACWICCRRMLSSDTRTSTISAG